jgi:multisubunit Na+/H+ antiporter MnhC subunit
MGGGRPVIAGALASVAAAWADHGDATRAAPASPLAQALMWAAVVLLLGVALVAIVSALARRGRPE